MIRPIRLPRRALVFIVATAAVSACAPPDTDIVATNTEQVGDYTVLANRSGDALHAAVCVQRPGRADAVADRVLEQLMSRGYRTITLDIYAVPARPLQQVTWTPQARNATPLTAPPPQHFCQAASEQSTEQ